MTQSKKTLIFEILELDASRYLKYSLLGSWWGGGVERVKHVFLTIFQSFPCPGDKLLKAGQGQEKGIWGSLSSLSKSERISRALLGVSKNSSLAICFSSSFSISLLPSLSLLFFFLSPGLAFSRMPVPLACYQLVEAYLVALNAQRKANFPPAKSRTGLPGP